jgi:hypothetical protein
MGYHQMKNLTSGKGMKKFILMHRIKFYLLSFKEWYLDTPERSLEEAYKAALLIQAIENKHFNGEKIAADSAIYGDSVINYFQSELKKSLKTIRMRLAEFYASRSVVRNYNSKIFTSIENYSSINSSEDLLAILPINHPDLILEKLKFIDDVLAKYSLDETPSLTDAQIIQTHNELKRTVENQPIVAINELENKKVTKTDGTSVVPRSILSTLNRIRFEFHPNSEQELVKNFRLSKRKTLISIRFIIVLVLVPFLTYILSRKLILEPIIDKFQISSQTVFLNEEMEERALAEMQRFEEKIKFENLMSEAPKISTESIEAKMREKVREITGNFRAESSDAIKNIFADILSLGAFSWLIIVSKREIAILKDFIDQIVYGLSDSAKAFIIILFTDMFVGFHSPHGWEVLLGGVMRHVGLPENHNFIFLFIATVPVVLDAIFKYWIFRYLNRISPSAVATYKNMNE